MQLNKSALNKLASDPVFFAKVCLGWHAHKEQEAWLRGAIYPQNWCRAGNRWGKTESIAIKHLWKCAFKIRDSTPENTPYITANTSISVDQARIPLDKAWRIINTQKAENFRKAFVKRYVLSPFPKLEFTNGSVWWARSTSKKGKYLHGHDYDYISNDEGAVDPDLGYILDEVLSMRLLDRGGQLDCISTGKRGSEFNKRFNKAKEDKGQFAYQGSTLSNPYINQDAVKKAIQSLPKEVIAERIYGGERQADSRIPYTSIIDAVSKGARLQPKQQGHRYSTGWDLAKVRDATVGITIDITEKPYRMVAFERFKEDTLQLSGTFWDYVYKRIRMRYYEYGGITTIDSTGLGTVIADQLADIGVQAITFTQPRRDELIGLLEIAFGLGAIAITNETQYNGEITWRFVDEIEQLEDSLSSLDAVTALALALYPVKTAIQLPNIGPIQRIKVIGQ